MKAFLTKSFRSLGLMHMIDRLKFALQRAKNFYPNKQFKKTHPHVALPPDYLMFESFQLNYEKYYSSGLAAAKQIAALLSAHIELKDKLILDWGCGPGRVVRHMPEVVGSGCSFFGCDYNETSIKWCSEHITNVQFKHNQLHPPLNYPSSYFDVVYGISIFTHLSAKNHLLWRDELLRVLKPGGILLLTLHGDVFRQILTSEELRIYETGRIVERGNVVEGHRVYTAFQPVGFVHDLFSEKAKVIEHIPGKMASWGAEQDKWIFRKN